MKRFLSIVIGSIFTLSTVLSGLLVFPENTYAASTISQKLSCFTNEKRTEKGKTFKAEETDIKVKINNISLNYGKDKPKITEVKLFEVGQSTHKQKIKGPMTNGKVLTFSNLKKNKKYYLTFSIEKNFDKKCVYVSYSIIPIEDVTNDFKFSPYYKDGDVFVKLNRNAQNFSGTLVLSKGSKNVRKEIKNAKTAVNLKDFKPFSEKESNPTKIDAFFKGKLKNKEIRIKHSISIVQYKKSTINKSEKNGKIRISLNIPSKLNKYDGKLEIKLRDQKKKENVAEKSGKGVSFFDFDKKLFTGKDIKVTATFKGVTKKPQAIYIANIKAEKTFNSSSAGSAISVLNGSSSGSAASASSSSGSANNGTSSSGSADNGSSSSGSANNGTSSSGSANNGNSGDKKDQNKPIKVEVQATSTFVDDEKLVIKTSVPGKDAKGDWTVEVGESKKTRKDASDKTSTFEFPLSELESNDGIYPLKVQFNGKAGDQKIKGETKKNLVFINADATAKEREVTAQASLKDIDEASGLWQFTYDGLTTSKESTEKEISIAFILSDPNTERDLIVQFRGKVNDKTVEGKIEKKVKPQVEDNGTTTDNNNNDNSNDNNDGNNNNDDNNNTNNNDNTSNNDQKTDQSNNNNQDNNTNHNTDTSTGSDTKTDDDNNSTNDQKSTDQQDDAQKDDSENKTQVNEEQTTKDNKKETPIPESTGVDEEANEEFLVTQASAKDNNQQVGGKLPKTATTYNYGILAGIILLFNGLLILWLRRKYQ